MNIEIMALVGFLGVIAIIVYIWIREIEVDKRNKKQEDKMDELLTLLISYFGSAGQIPAAERLQMLKDKK